MSKQAAKDVMSGLVAKRIKLSEELRRIDVAIDALQHVCEHNMVDNGHDSHYNHEKCTICGFEDNRC